MVLVVGAVAGWWFFIRSDAPERANIQTAGEVLAQQADDELAEVEGAWNVDTTVGSFTDFTSTWAGYRFDEELVQIGTTTAVGRTPGVSGTMTIDGGKVMDVDVAVDLTTLKSDKDRRPAWTRPSRDQPRDRRWRAVAGGHGHPHRPDQPAPHARRRVGAGRSRPWHRR